MIERRAEQVAYTNPYVTVFFDDVTFPGGTEGRYTRIRSGSGHPGVVVLPLRAGHVGLVAQYRYPVGAALWELPRGGSESADTAAEAARELAEETGARTDDFTCLGVVHPDSGILETSAVCYLARLPAGAAFAAVDEVDAASWVPVADLLAMVADGTITDAFTIAAVTRAHLRDLLT